MNSLSHQAKTKKQLEFIFGGTFDPIHLGHLAVIKMLNKLDPSITIRLIPCADPPIKSQPKANFFERIELIKLALQDEKAIFTENIIIDKREASYSVPSYTIETLSSLKREFTNTRFVLVIGADNLVNFHQWNQWDKLSEICHLLVFNRPDIILESIESAMQAAKFSVCDNFQELTTKTKGRSFFVNMPEMHQSSSQIRKMIENNESLDLMLSPSVIEYIRTNQLYMSAIN